MRVFATAISVLFMVLACPVLACTVSYWHPPTPESAFRAADVVVHAKVMSQSVERGLFTGKIKLLKILKGSFSGDTVFSRGSTECGFGSFRVGEEYIFFFSGCDRFVSGLTAPIQYSTKQILDNLRKGGYTP